MADAPPGRGNHLDPVDKAQVVFRLARPSMKEGVSPAQVDLDEFVLSSADKATSPAHLSVWVEVLTTPLQALAFMGPNSNKRLILKMKVEDIENVGTEEHPSPLQVLWTHLEVLYLHDPVFYEGKPGGEGHAGIVGLDVHPEGMTQRQAKNSVSPGGNPGAPLRGGPKGVRDTSPSRGGAPTTIGGCS